MQMCISIFVIFSIIHVAQLRVDRPRGVAISKAGFYVKHNDFTCLDGSATIPFDHLNDDYCDCIDASDEPGTSACPNGSFHCTNAGHQPLNIPSSRVNDGICDCCDGTDEYDSSAKCTNICKLLGKAAREEAERLKVVIEEGYQVYQEYAKQGTSAKEENVAKVNSLKEIKEAAEAKKKEMQQFKEEAEIPEKEAKDAHEKAVNEEKARLEALKSETDCEDAFQELDANGDGVVSIDEMQGHVEFDIDSNGDVSQEEAREYLEDKELVDFETFKEIVWPNIKAIYKSAEVAMPSESEEKEEAAPEDDYEDHYDEADEYEPPYDEEDQEDDEVDEPDPEEETAEATAIADFEYDDSTKLLIAAADKARLDFTEAEREFQDAERELRDVTDFLSLDLGPNNVYFPLKGSCYEFTDTEYTYKFCPFEKATQRSKNGGSETSLGRWGRWDGPEDNKHSVMLLENGQNCWNGPNRSVKVHMKCGINNELIAATEPSRCEYEYHFLTPAACSKQVYEAALTATDYHDEL